MLEVFADPDRRLITLAADKDGKTIAEVAHEALFDHWSELRRWLDQDRDQIRLARRVELAAKEWVESGRTKGMLWRPPLLDLLRGYSKDKASDIPAVQLEFFNASESQQRRSTWMRRGGIATAILGLLILAGGLWIYSGQQAEIARREAEFAQRQTALLEQAETEKQRADIERDKALRTQSLFLAEHSEQETRRGNATNGILLALEALPKNMIEADRPP